MPHLPCVSTHGKAHFTEKASKGFVSQKELVDNIYYSWEKNRAQKSTGGPRNEEENAESELALPSVSIPSALLFFPAWSSSHPFLFSGPFPTNFPLVFVNVFHSESSLKPPFQLSPAENTAHLQPGFFPKAHTLYRCQDIPSLHQPTAQAPQAPGAVERFIMQTDVQTKSR